MDGGQPPVISDSAVFGFFHKGFSEVIVSSCLWAIYLILFPLSLRALFKGRVWSKANILLGLTTFIMFTATNVYFIVLLKFQSTIVEVMIRSNSAGVLSNLQRMMSAQDAIKGCRIITTLLRLVNFILGDAVVVHRAYVLVGLDLERRPVRVWASRVGLLMLMVASAGMSFYDGARTIIEGKELSFAITDSNRTGDTVALCLSLATNMLASAIIVFTTWQQIRATLVTPTPAVQRISRLVLILTETAVAYCFVQVLAIVCLAIPTRQSSIGDIISNGYLAALNILSALYPTILIIIIGRENQSGSRTVRTSTRGQLPNTMEPERSVALSTVLPFPSTFGSSVMDMDDAWLKTRAIA